MPKISSPRVRTLTGPRNIFVLPLIRTIVIIFEKTFNDRYVAYSSSDTSHVVDRMPLHQHVLHLTDVALFDLPPS